MLGRGDKRGVLEMAFEDLYQVSHPLTYSFVVSLVIGH